MNHRLYEALQGEVARCKRWYGESELCEAVGAWAAELEKRVRRLVAIPERIDTPVTTVVIASSRTFE